MSEEWLWTIPLKITESECSKFVESTDSGNSKFYARSLLSMVCQVKVTFSTTLIDIDIIETFVVKDIGCRNMK